MHTITGKHSRLVLSMCCTASLAIAIAGAATASAAAQGTDSSVLAGHDEEIARRIIESACSDSGAYERLAYLCDTFGPRLSGSRALDAAFDWALDEFRRQGLEGVGSDTVMVPHWERGSESLTLLAPRRRTMQVMGLGGSVGTGPGGLTAQALVVRNFEELRQRAAEARGNIVVFAVPYRGYGETVQYRSRGAIEAARAGAVACLIRSVTPMSLQTPHTGMMHYADSLPRIPHAAITPEDAAMLLRMQRRGQTVTLRLFMEARSFPDTLSRNVMAEIRGWEHPEELVVFGGHLDSWDVGDGAHDDASGCIAALQALTILQRLGLRPRRSIRVVFWTNEENGARGGEAYARQHAGELPRHVLALEADAGIFHPRGFGFTGSDSAMRIVREAASPLRSIGADTVTRGGGGVDIGPLTRAGVPSAGLTVDGTRYFWYHHSDADTVDSVDPRDLNLCVAALAVLVYAVADNPARLPR